MRVAFLTHEPFYPPSGGGSAEAVYLVQELVRRGHAVHLFCPRVDGPDAVRRRFGVELHEFKAWRMGRYTRLRTFKYLLYPLFLQRMVEASARALRFDLVLSQHAIAAVTAGRLRGRLRVPVVMNFLDYLTGFLETWPSYLAPKPLIRAVERFELSLPLRYQADAVLTVSDALADYFAGAGFPRSRLLPIYYGYDADLFPLRDPGRTAESSGQPVVVMHGSFDHHHLGPIAVEALAYAWERKPGTVFRFVGRQTPSLAKFATMMRKGLPELKLECVGFVPYTEIASRLADASVGIVPYEESTGTHCAFVAKIVEYVGLGLPVVSTPLNSARRYFGNEPLVRFSQFDGATFGEQIVRWLDEPLDRRDALARAASERVRTALDWRAISRNAIDFVEETQRNRKLIQREANV
jgi:glycosyltransferase involved in cell wall biosynthesis